MDKFNLNDYGKCIVKEETIKDNEGNIKSFEYETDNLETKYTTGKTSILFSAIRSNYYEVSVSTFKKEPSEETSFVFYTHRIIPLAQIINYIEKMYETSDLNRSGLILDSVVYNYANSETKDEDGFYINITVNNKDILFYVNKDRKVVKDNNIYYVYDSDDFESTINKAMYIILDNDVYYIETDKNKQNKKMVDIYFATSDKNRLKNLKFKFVPDTNLPSMMYVYDNNISFSGKGTKDEYYITYLDYCDLPDNITEDIFGTIDASLTKDIPSRLKSINVYKEKILDDNKTDFVSVLHRELYDDFDISLNFSNENLYCIDRADFNAYDGIVYKKEIFYIDDDKIVSLDNKISDLNTNNPLYPVL